MDNSFFGCPGPPDVPPLVGSAILFNSFLPDGIDAARVKGMTFRQPPYAHPNAAQRPVLFDGLQHVFRAGRVESASWKGAMGRCTTYKDATGRSRATATEKETYHFPLEIREGASIALRRGLMTIDHSGLRRSRVQADRLADTPPDAVARHRFADRARQREADAGPAGIRLAHAERRKEGPGETGPLVIHPAKIRGSQQTNTFRKARDALPLGAYREFVAAPRAAPRQNGTSVLGFHAGAEPVGLRAPTIIGLKSAFRHCTPSSLL